VILGLARALVLVAFAHQAHAVERAACGYAKPCADPQAAAAAVAVLRWRWHRTLPLYLRP